MQEEVTTYETVERTETKTYCDECGGKAEDFTIGYFGVTVQPDGTITADRESHVCPTCETKYDDADDVVISEGEHNEIDYLTGGSYLDYGGASMVVVAGGLLIAGFLGVTAYIGTLCLAIGLFTGVQYVIRATPSDSLANAKATGRAYGMGLGLFFGAVFGLFLLFG